MFNILSHGNFAAGGLPFAGRPVLDAFAGTGAFGLEALSRGARRCLHRERTRGTGRAAPQCESARRGGPGYIVAGDATRPPRAVFACAVAFLDPPYGSGLAGSALAALAATGWIAPEALAVVELAAAEKWTLLSGFTPIDERVYGAARLVFLRYDQALQGDRR